MPVEAMLEDVDVVDDLMNKWLERQLSLEDSPSAQVISVDVKREAEALE